MAEKKSKCYSGIGGQAVLEGIMMKNKDKYAVAVRKPDGEIAVDVEEYTSDVKFEKARKIPFVRGIFNFVDSLVLGMKCLNYSASFYEEETDKPVNPKKEQLISTFVTILSVVLAVGLFIVLPYYISTLCKEYVRNDSLMAIIEGVVRLGIFLLYVVGISLMKDIRRLYSYHGAEHKCINCIERGRPLTVDDVMRSSRLHKRCGTSFIFFVMIVSIILFFFIRVNNPVQRVVLRILLLPVVAGISYEIISLAGKSDNILVKIISAPGMLIQRLTTKEPDASMVEVAIVAVEAVYDWRKFLNDNYGYEYTAGSEKDAEPVEDGEESGEEA
ncbi:MAG: DUF1385 domain-containing protein [Acetatifactor sp.]|nr:DUF1385 domain-containing protein [Acetatifactor sp.]